jgi:hypothetical protein
LRILAPRLERKGASVGSDARPFRGGLAALGVACLSAFSAIEADAEVRVEGNRDEMHVRVENDIVGHVLEVLGQNVSLRYRCAAPLNKVIGGRFSGSLEQVLPRVLAGYDFVVRYNPQGVEIFVVRESGAAPIPPPPIQDTPQPQRASSAAGPDAPQPQRASTVADQDAASASLAPRFARRHAPSQYDLGTASRIPANR